MQSLFSDQARAAVSLSFMRAEIARATAPVMALSKQMDSLWASGEQRRKDCEAFRLMYDNDWRDALRAAIKARFREENYKRLMLVLDNSINVLRWVINRVAGIYKKPPTRSLWLEEEELTDPRFLAYQKESQLDLTMLQVNRMAVLYQDILVGPYVATNGDGSKRLRYRFLAPEKCEVITQSDDPTAIKALFYPFVGRHANGSDARRYAYWDANHYREFDAQWKELPVFGPDGQENVGSINPYGRVPFVVFRPELPIDRFWHWKKTQGLYDTTINGGVGFTDILHAIKNQSFKQLALTGDELDKIDPNIILDPSQILDLGSNAVATVLDLQANIPALFETVMQLLSFAVHTYGIMPKSFRGKMEATSGYALTVQEKDLREIHAEHRMVFAPSEQELYDVTRAVNNAHPEFDELPAGALHIAYEEAGPGENPQALAKHWSNLVNNDPPLATPIQAIMQIHGVDEVQAEAIFEDALKWKLHSKQTLSPVPLAPMFPGATPADSVPEPPADPKGDPVPSEPGVVPPSKEDV